MRSFAMRASSGAYVQMLGRNAPARDAAWRCVAPATPFSSTGSNPPKRDIRPR